MIYMIYIYMRRLNKNESSDKALRMFFIDTEFHLNWLNLIYILQFYNTIISNKANLTKTQFQNISNFFRV